jgi:hypothetical protein
MVFVKFAGYCAFACVTLYIMTTVVPFAQMWQCGKWLMFGSVWYVLKNSYYQMVV